MDSTEIVASFSRLPVYANLKSARPTKAASGGGLHNFGAILHSKYTSEFPDKLTRLVRATMDRLKCVVRVSETRSSAL